MVIEFLNVESLKEYKKQYNYCLDKGVEKLVKLTVGLQCKVRVKCQALHIYHRFKRCIGEAEYDTNLVAAACISLSVKSNDEDIEFDAIVMALFSITVTENVYPPSIRSGRYKTIKKSVVMMELIILRLLEFSVNQKLAVDYLRYFLNDASEDLSSENRLDIVTQKCMMMLSDFYLCKECLKYEAIDIMLAIFESALYLTGSDLKLKEIWNSKCWIKKSNYLDLKFDIVNDIFRICVITPIFQKYRDRIEN